MNLTKTLNGTELTIALDGRLDTTTSPVLEKELAACLDQAQSVVFDMSKLEYVSSAGLRVLLATHKKMLAKGGMIVRHVSEMVMEVFDVTGFSDILTIE